jgi:hypothetical protein
MAHRSGKGDWLPALEKAGKFQGIAAGQVPVPFFRARRESELLQVAYSESGPGFGNLLSPDPVDEPGGLSDGICVLLQRITLV